MAAANARALGRGRAPSTPSTPAGRPVRHRAEVLERRGERLRRRVTVRSLPAVVGDRPRPGRARAPRRGRTSPAGTRRARRGRRRPRAETASEIRSIVAAEQVELVAQHHQRRLAARHRPAVGQVAGAGAGSAPTASGQVAGRRRDHGVRLRAARAELVQPRDRLADGPDDPLRRARPPSAGSLARRRRALEPVAARRRISSLVGAARQLEARRLRAAAAEQAVGQLTQRGHGIPRRLVRAG